MSDLLVALSKIIPVYPFEVPQGTPIPYGVWVKSETPIRTKDGICGYEGSLTISIYAGTLETLHSLAERVIEVVDNTTYDGRDYYYESTSEENYSDIGLVQKDLIFNYLQ